MACQELILLQAGEIPQARIFWAVLGLIGLIVVGLVVVTQVKKRMAADDQPISAGFTLSDLRRMHVSGQISNEEFEKAKAKVIEAAKRAAEREAVKAKAVDPRDREFAEFARRVREKELEAEDQG